MIYDGHIHIMADGGVGGLKLRQAMKKSGMSGGMLISLPPRAFPYLATGHGDTRTRIDNVLAWSGEAGLWPCYWIDPLEKDAVKQVSYAVERGIKAFKVICNRFYPGDPRAMRVYRAIAAVQRPVLFHSGILWDGAVSSCYNRPAEFEALIEVPGLVFSLAHISWPWCDELIAVYGKFSNARKRRPVQMPEMYVDLTPGTPLIYRREALTRLFTTGYDVGGNVIFGSDCTADAFDVKWTKIWIRRDTAIYRSLRIPQCTQKAIFADNLQRFIEGRSQNH